MKKMLGNFIFSMIIVIFVVGMLAVYIKTRTKKTTYRYVKNGHQPIVQELIHIVDADAKIKEALQASLKKADRTGIKTLSEYYNYLDMMITLLPTARNLLPKCLEFYYVVDLAPNNFLKDSDSFQKWLVKFMTQWGDFLNTVESGKHLDSFKKDSKYNIDDYYEGPSGWLTFNQFFARQPKPGRRPIDGICDDSVVVAAADSVYHGQWKISKDHKVTTKGFTWSIDQLLAGSPYADRFKNGIYTHSYLSAHDCHRFVVPVSGTVKEIRNIAGKILLDVVKNKDGSFDMTDGDSYQLTQMRGLIVLDSPIGYVAVLPIGMGQVSSITLTAEKGAKLHKGDEFGFFQFGGSDIIILFEANKVNITAKVDTHYNYGKAIAKAIKK